MAAENSYLGSSLQVPCVQELAKESLNTVPPRYLRPDQDSPVLPNADSVLQVPVIDMRSLYSEELMNLELEKLHNASKDWGFFQLVNHGVSASLTEKVKMVVKELFDLPMEEKEKYWQKPGELEGFGQVFVVSEEQKLDWGDMFFVATLPHNLRNPHLFPKLPLPFRNTLEAYSGELKNLALKIVTFMTEALGMDPKEVKEIFEEGGQHMRMNYYPRCPQPELVMGLTAHSDADLLTILLQVNDTEGLQIKKDGKWVSIKPLPNAFVINIGDMLEVVTNGTYKSVEHRATVNSVTERISVATFYNPRVDGEVGPAASLLSPDRPALFKRVSFADFMRSYVSRKLDGKKHLDFMRTQNFDA